MDIREINGEIKRLEATETNYQNCNRLAILYVIRDHLDNSNVAPAAEYLPRDSEFLDVVSRAPMEGVLSIMDEHMECVKTLYPKEYSAVINRIMNLQ